MKFKPTTVRMHDNVIMCDTADMCSIKVFDAITGQQVTAIRDLNIKFLNQSFIYQRLMKSFEKAGDFPTFISVIADLLPLSHIQPAVTGLPIMESLFGE